MKNAPKAEVPPAPKSTCPVCGAPFEGYHYCNIKPAPPTPVQDFSPGSAYQIEGEENGRRLLSSAPPAPVSEPPKIKAWAVFYRHGGDYVCHLKPLHLGYLFETAEAADKEVNGISRVRDAFAVEATLVLHGDLPEDARLEGYENCLAHDEPCGYDEQLLALKAQNATLTAERERLRDLIVKHAVTSGLIAEANAIRAIRAAREAGKS